MEKMVEIKHLKKYFKMSKGLLGQDKEQASDSGLSMTFP